MGVESQSFWLHCLSYRPHCGVVLLFPAQEPPRAAVCILTSQEQRLHKVGAQVDIVRMNDEGGYPVSLGFDVSSNPLEVIGILKCLK